MRNVLVMALLAALALPAWGRRRDPLTPAEADQLRETAQEPVKRLLLMLKFARARIATIEQLRSDSRFAPDRGKQVHDMLEDFGTLIDEINDNVDDYAGRNADLRKALKEIATGGSEFQLKLRTLKESAASGPDAAKEAREYSYVLENVIESVNSIADNVRKTLDEQEVLAREKKLKKPE